MRSTLPLVFAGLTLAFPAFAEPVVTQYAAAPASLSNVRSDGSDFSELEAPAFRGRPLETRIEQLEQELALAHLIIARICEASLRIPRACGHRFHEHVATDSTACGHPVEMICEAI